MIKTVDIIGSSIVLFSYFFMTPLLLLIPIAIIPFTIGVSVSIYGLISRASKIWILYLSTVFGISMAIFIFLGFPSSISIIIIYIAPGLIASSSLIIIHFTKNNSQR